MGYPVDVDRRDDIAIVSLANPPVNAFDLGLRRALDKTFDELEHDDSVRAIVLIGQGRGFSAGADIAEFETGLSEPSLPSLCNRIEAFAKPVVAAIHGFTLAGGFELALAAHYRVADRATRIGLPEVRIGLLPGAGGTQRLPRVVGAEQALRIMLDGTPMPVTDPANAPLIDAFSDGALKDSAAAFCASLLAEGRGPRPTRQRVDGFADPRAFMTAVETARNTVSNGPEPAKREIVSLVEMAQLLPFRVGLDCEWDAFGRMMDTPQSRALRYLFFAERQSGKLPVPSEVPLPEIDRVAVLGGGPLARDLAIACIGAGLKTGWGTRDPGVSAQGLKQLIAHLDTAVINGGLTPGRRDGMMANLSTGRSEDMARDAQVVIMAARGQAGVPIADGATRVAAQPGDVVALGMRFAKPAYDNRLLEVLAGDRLDDGGLAVASAFARRLGHLPIYVKSSRQSLVQRLIEAAHRAADSLVEMGATPVDVDRAVSAWGWTYMPFAGRDGVGLAETARAVRGPGASNLAQVLLDAGRTGRAGQRGFYAYLLGAATADSSVEALLAPHRLGDSAAGLDDNALAWLLVAAVANEALRILEDGMVRHARDIDVALVVGHGFARWRGGPMKAVSEKGLLSLARRMEALGHPDEAFWTPRAAWLDCIKSGTGLETLAATS